MSESNCRICGRALTASASIEHGIGPVCGATHQHHPADMLSASFDYFMKGGVIVILDLNKGRSVTNDAENVIQTIRAAGMPVDTCPVIYRDSINTYDQLRVFKGQFAGFKSIGTTDIDTAIESVKRVAA